jgi:hypothetical protein
MVLHHRQLLVSMCQSNDNKNGKEKAASSFAHFQVERFGGVKE